MAISQKASQRLLLLKFQYTRTFCNSFTPRSSLQLRKFSNLDSLVSSLIISISSCTSLTYCRMIHCLVMKSISYNHGFIGDQLVSAYMRIGCTEDAQNLFDELPKKDLISWNSLISGFSRSGDLGKCLNAFSRMKFETEIIPNEVTILPVISACAGSGALDLGKYIHGFALKLGLLSQVKILNALVNMYGKSGSLDASRCIFDEMPVKNLVSWNSIIAVHVQLGFAEEGKRYFIQMRRFGIVSDQATVVTLLQACGILGLRKLLESIHGYINNCGLYLNLAVVTALLRVYSDLGLLSSSEKIFREIIDPDAVAWTAMIACYAAHGCGKEAIQLFELMVGEEGVVPDNVTFTHLLSACSHSGLVKDGKYYFENMSKVYCVEPRVDHYSCMVDLYGRSGHLDDAYELIQSMPMEPNSGVWGALIGACRVYGNVELGREVSEKLFALNPSDSRNYIMLSNMYSAAGQWEDASKVRALMMKQGNLIRNPGRSFIEHGNRIHSFVMGDESHPESKQIYNKLEELIGKSKVTGYATKTEFVLHDVDEDAKEDMINEHSEKLAMAYGLVVSNANEPLIITKNLRICGDCHSFAKLVSLIEMRIIIIRDRKRFHHFANGLCSCGDYW